MPKGKTRHRDVLAERCGSATLWEIVLVNFPLPNNLLKTRRFLAIRLPLVCAFQRIVAGQQQPNCQFDVTSAQRKRAAFMQSRHYFRNIQYLLHALSFADWFMLLAGVALVGLLTLLLDGTTF
jgi:hypothetical protein